MKRYLKIKYLIVNVYLVVSGYFLVKYYDSHNPIVYWKRLVLFLAFIGGFILISWFHQYLQEREWRKETQRQLDEIKNQA